MRICDLGDTSRMWGRGKSAHEFNAVEHLDHMPEDIKRKNLRLHYMPVKIWLSSDEEMQKLLDEYGVSIEHVCVMNPSSPIRSWVLTLGEFLLASDPTNQPVNGVRKLPPVVRQYLTFAGAKIRTLDEEAAAVGEA